jgi:hypothetical protein
MRRNNKPDFFNWFLFSFVVVLCAISLKNSSKLMKSWKKFVQTKFFLHLTKENNEISHAKVLAKIRRLYNILFSSVLFIAFFHMRFYTTFCVSKTHIHLQDKIFVVTWPLLLTLTLFSLGRSNNFQQLIMIQRHKF